MKFIHVADLHIGKRLYENSLMEDQAFALDFIAAQAEKQRPDAIFIAGDVYDRAVPSAEAVSLLSDFLMRLSDTGAKVFAIGGNHDSQERLAFARAMLAREGLFISGPYEGRLEKYSLEDADIWLMPHIRPREVERFFDGAAFHATQDAVAAILERENVDGKRANVLLCHQFVTGAGDESVRSDSEVEPVGGESAVDAALFDKFDYVALGHLHAPQKAGRECVRYSGSPLKYSFSEARHKKSMVMGSISGKNVEIELVPIPLRRDMRDIKGRLSDILAAAEPTEDYVRVTLTDETPPLSPMERLSAAYPNLVRLELAPRGSAGAEPETVAGRTPLELFAEFYEKTSGAPLTGEMLEMAADALNAVTENS
jgi:exonuclease SbcD